MRLIDADTLQAQIQQDYDIFAGSTYLPDKARRDELSNVIARIINAPTIEAEDVRRGMCINCIIHDEPIIQGKWIQISPAKIYECSECGRNIMTDDIDTYYYCPNCGAKMI